MDPRYNGMSEHRVSMLGSSLRRAEDPETSRDPRVRAVVASLRGADYAPAPTPEFRAELRAQLVAVAPRIIAESAPETAPAPASAKPARHREPARRRRFVRPLAIAGTVAAAFLVLLGGAVWMSQKALPGDSLYGLKRASENVQLSLTSGDTDRGHAYLSLAQTRVQEARALLHRDSASASGRGPLAGGLSSHTAGLISKNLDSANADLRHGSDLLNTKAVTSRTQSPLTVVTRWAPGQLTRLKALADALPAGPVRTQTLSSWTLTNAALERSRSLGPAVTGGCASGARSDRLGPVPTCGATPAAPAAPTPAATPTQPATHPAGSATTRPAGSSGTTTSRSGKPAAPRSSGKASSSRGRSGPTLPPILPTKAPISVGRCGISVGLGPIGVHLGGCPSHT